MFFSGLNMDDILFRLIAFLIAITVHELAHALVAYSLGDPTPKRDGRLTLNPIAHMDILGTLLILFGPFGWAKPVTFNPYNFKGNKRVGKILTTFAGPLANFVTAVLFAFIFKMIFPSLMDDAWSNFAVELVNAVVYINVILFLFNLLPIPPLDGYWIVRELLPQRTALKMHNVEKYGPFVLLLLVFFGWAGFIIFPLQLMTNDLIRTITGLS
ncbi:site-2 protease family protein [Tumebacillus sp. DT12]|uniref:Site-2 protease family protein n=1 Tax=Tumebacillus lacus TaxID=2995335 RepID=A0ABT3WZX7_9BACL|nr:site-2 protease family protein [Tumebacillus lacus]MCX7569077.1 site-2 protease family protein [Tumebacillus lacus]